MAKEKKIEISFIGKDGNRYIFKSEINELNGMWMWTLDDWTECYAGNKANVNTIIKDIKKLDPDAIEKE